MGAQGVLHVRMWRVVKFIKVVERIQDLPLRHETYFKLKTFENQQMWGKCVV